MLSNNRRNMMLYIQLLIFMANNVLDVPLFSFTLLYYFLPSRSPTSKSWPTRSTFVLYQINNKLLQRWHVNLQSNVNRPDVGHIIVLVINADEDARSPPPAAQHLRSAASAGPARGRGALRGNGAGRQCVSRMAAASNVNRADVGHYHCALGSSNVDKLCI